MNQIEKLESMSEEDAREELVRICHGTPDREIAAQWGVQEYEIKRLRGKYGIKKDTSGSIVYNASVKKIPVVNKTPSFQVKIYGDFKGNVALGKIEALQALLVSQGEDYVYELDITVSQK